jgi:hypothetical protein
METYYATASNYGASSATDGCSTSPAAAPWNDSTTGMLNLSDADNYPTGVGTTLECYTLGTSWAATARINGGSGNYYCVDSSGTSKDIGGTTNTISGTDTTC